jgi:PHD/YefM family antitoxin component YafN of YafNO toxin-antitoxin module
MIAYRSDELIPSSDFAKKFGSYLAKIKENALDKIAILKNNHIEAVLVSKDEYERMQEALELIEHYEIYQTIEKRTSLPYQSVSQKEMLARLGIDENELEE